MDSPAVQTYLVIAGSYLIGGSQKVPILGMSVSPAVLIGSSVGAASIISTLSAAKVRAHSDTQKGCSRASGCEIASASSGRA